MNVLFLLTRNNFCPHFETALELISNHLEKGDNVYLLTCLGALDVCAFNLEKTFEKCFSCRYRFYDALNRLNSSRIKIIKLNKKKSSENYKLLPEEFNSLEELKAFKLFNVDFGAAVACSLISEFRNHYFDALLYKDRIYKELRASLMIYESVYQTLGDLKPDIFYVLNGRFADVRPAVRASQKLGITFYSYDMDNNSYAICKNSLPHDLSCMKKEILDIWDKSPLNLLEKENIGRSWFLDKRYNEFVLGQERSCLPLGFDSSKRNFVIFNSSLDELETFPEWKENTIYKTENEGLFKILEAFKNESNIKFYLRIHPNLKGLKNRQIQDLKKLDSLGYENLKIIWPDDKVDSYALLKACEKTIVFSSTTGLEACFYGKPAILLGRTMYEHLECCYIPKNHDELVNMIYEFLPAKKNDKTLKYGYWVLKRRIKFKRFNKNGLTFLGRRLAEDWGLQKRIAFKFYNSLDKIKMFLKEFNGES